MSYRTFQREVGCARCDAGDYSRDHCHVALPDQWGYGQPCCLIAGHNGKHRYEQGNGFVIEWGYE